MTIVKRRPSHAIVIMEFLKTATRLANPELDRLKCINILSKLCLKSLCNFPSIGPFIMKKSDPHSRIILHSQHLVNLFEHGGWRNNQRLKCRAEANSISLIVQAVYSPKMISRETRNPELCV
jgi:hypothetical protein